MSAITTDLQVIPTAPLDGDAHPAQTPLDHARVRASCIRELGDYWVECAAVLEQKYAERYVVPIVATALGLIGAAIVGTCL